FEGRFGPLEQRARPAAPGDGELTFAGHRLVYGYLPAAHTNGGLYVHPPELDVLVAGGAVGSDSWPLLDYWNGRFIGGLVRAHESVAALVNDEPVVIPAHGPAISGGDLLRHRDMYQQLFRDLSYLM